MRFDKKIPAIYMVLFSGLLLRLYFILSSHYISPDGTQYAGIGYHFLHSFLYQSNGAQFPDIVQPPLYPFFSGLFSYVFSMEYAAKFTSLIFGLLLIYAVYRFAYDLKSDKKYALAAAWISALHPALILISSEAASEALYLFWILSGLAVGWVYLNKPRPRYVLLLSIIWLAAFLTRAEGVAFFAVQFFIFLSLIWKKKCRLHLLYFLLPFFIGVAVYMQFTARTLGYQTPSPKLKLIRSHARMYHLFKDELKKMPRQQREWKVKYSLTPQGNELAANALLYRRWKIKPNEQADAEKTSFLFSLTRRVFYNAALIPMKIKNGFAFPLIFLLLLFLSLPALKKTNKKGRGGLERRFLWYLFFMSAGALSFLVSHVEDRFLYALLPFLIFPAAEGGLLFYKLLIRKTDGYSIHKYNDAFILLIAFAGFLLSYKAIVRKHQMKEYYYQAGLQLQPYVTKQDKIAAVMPQAVFFSRSKYSVLPFASLHRLLLYLRTRKISFVLLEQKDINNLPVATELLGSLALKAEFSAAGKIFYLLSLNEER